jgi:hypothetical protein
MIDCDDGVIRVDIMKARCTTTLFLVVVSSWPMLYSLVLSCSSDINIFSEENKIEQDDDLLQRLYVIMYEDDNGEQETSRDNLLLTKQENAVSRLDVAMDKTPNDNRERRSSDETVSFIDTIKAETSDRNLEDMCGSELSIVQNCFLSDSGCDVTCITDLLEYFSQGSNDTETCSTINVGLCIAVVSCGCEMCEVEFSDFFNCQLPTCFVRCGSEQPICPEELDKVSACMKNMEACARCINDAFGPIQESSGNVSCAAITTGICPAIRIDCDCGECSDLLEEVSIHRFSTNTFRFFFSYDFC